LKSGVVVKPQVLREWFCNELGKFGVPDRFVDALCGRLPHSVLARRYSDYGPDNLKTNYDKANLTVIS
jgi:intergrase/recombinase